MLNMLSVVIVWVMSLMVCAGANRSTWPWSKPWIYLRGQRMGQRMGQMFSQMSVNMSLPCTMDEKDVLYSVSVLFD